MRPLVMTLLVLLYAAISLWGVDWGLYGEKRAAHLFPGSSFWTPGRVAGLCAERPPADPALGADVDPDPVPEGQTPVVLNDSDAGIAEIYARYLLYSHQPDEMITFRALSRIDPEQRQFDPKLYQYGGLFLYPLGGLLKLAAVTGYLRLGTLEDLLAHPHDFARYYVVGRIYVILWGLLGLWAMYAIGRRLHDWRSGALAALLYVLLPIAVSLSHECKPHLPGTVLMLWATLWALRYVDTGEVRYRLLLAGTCGLATGMVLSSAWIFVLIPLSEWLTRSSTGDRLARTVVFSLFGLTVYAVVNPYVVINLLKWESGFISNLSNSTAMYHIDAGVQGFATATGLLISGSSIMIVVGGLVMLVALWGWDWRRTLIMTLPAAVVYVQCGLLGADKPGEYARFTLFPAVILCLLLAVGLYRFLVARWYQGVVYSLAAATLVGWSTLAVLVSLRLDGSPDNTRYTLAARLQGEPTQAASHEPIGTLREPAPYGFPPLDFATRPVVLIRPANVRDWPEDRTGWPARLIVPLDGVEGVDLKAILQDGYYRLENPTAPEDPTTFTWANKPLVMLVHGS